MKIQQLTYSIFLCCLSWNVMAQDQHLIDSLTQQLTQRMPSAKRVDIYNELSRQTNKIGNLSIALEHGATALQLAHEDYYLEGKAMAHSRMAWALRKLTNYDSALWHYQEAIKIEKQLDNAYGVGRAKNSIGIIYKQQGLYLNAIPVYKETLTLFNELEKWSAASQVMNNLGTCYLEVGAFEEAIALFLQTLTFYQTQDSPKQLANTHLKLSAFYRRANDNIEAEIHAQKALELSKSINHSLYIVMAQENLGLALKRQSKFEQAISTFTEGLTLSQQHQFVTYEQKFLNNLGNTYRKSGSYDKALNYLNQGLAINPPLKIKSSTLYNIGLVYQKMGQPQKAKSHLEQALAMSLETKDIFNRLRILKDLANLHHTQRDYQKSNDYNELYINLSDSLHQSYHQALNYKLAFQIEQNQKELLEQENLIQQERIAKVEAKNLQQKQYLYALAVILGFVLLSSFLALRNYRQKKALESLKLSQDREVFKAMLEGQEAERKHFSRTLMGSVLQDLSALPFMLSFLYKKAKDFTHEDKEYYKKIMALLQKAMGEIRNLAHNMSPLILNEGSLLDVLENLKFNSDGQFMIEIKLIEDGLRENHLDAKMEANAFRIIQELVNFMAEHARTSLLTFYLVRNNYSFKIALLEDRQGFYLKLPDFRESIQMANVQSRVNALNGSLTVSTSEENGGLIVVIQIPLDD